MAKKNKWKSELDENSKPVNVEYSEQGEKLAVEQVQPKQVQPMVVEPAPVAPAVEKVDFDAWFVMRGKKIPPQHHKEIVRADFKGRGLSQCESLEDFDAALRKYGIKLV